MFVQKKVCLHIFMFDCSCHEEEILSEKLRKRDKRNPCCVFKYILREKLLDLV